MEDRIHAARMVEDLYSGKIDFEQFIMEFPENDDDKELFDLFGLIEHEPPIGGLFGECKYDHDSRMKRISELIAKLKK